MNELYPNATAEDLNGASDSTCIICREEMQVVDPTAAANNDEDNPEAAAYRNDNEQNLDQPKKLPCGHIFHFHCLRSWLERQQTCPTCRRSVLVDGKRLN
jgi:E3 ubiquitin-protein ligase synoviolin